MLRIIGLKAYCKGYTGFLENDESYLFFNTVRGGFRPVQSYPKEDFESHHHFITLMSKFVKSSFFLKTPVEVSSVDMATLDRIQMYRNAERLNLGKKLDMSEILM